MTRATLLLLVVCGLCGGRLSAAPGAGEQAGPGLAEDLLADDLLLDGLDDLIAPAAVRPGDSKPAPQASPNQPPPRGGGRGADAPSWLPNRKELDRMMKDGLEGRPPAGQRGEDLGESPLVTLRSMMDRAVRLIAKGDPAAETRPTQEKVITQLDELIKKMEKQCKNCQGGGACSKPKPQASRRSKPGQPKPGQPKPSQQASAGKKPTKPNSPNAAQRSSLRLGQARPAEADARRNADVLKRVWGRLPERLREQMLQSDTDEYLPEYRAEIEQYFRRLAEEPEGE